MLPEYEMGMNTAPNQNSANTSISNEFPTIKNSSTESQIQELIFSSFYHLKSTVKIFGQSGISKFFRPTKSHLSIRQANFILNFSNTPLYTTKILLAQQHPSQIKISKTPVLKSY